MNTGLRVYMESKKLLRSNGRNFCTTRKNLQEFVVKAAYKPNVTIGSGKLRRYCFSKPDTACTSEKVSKSMRTFGASKRANMPYFITAFTRQNQQQ